MMVNQKTRQRVREIRRKLHCGKGNYESVVLAAVGLREKLYSAGLPVYVIDKWFDRE